MIVVQRTHPLKRDRDWLPAHVRRRGRLVAGAVWGGAGVALVGTAVAAPATLLLWKLLMGAGLGMAVAGERIGHAIFRRQLLRMARGEVELSGVGAREEGELVVVRGTIEAAAPIAGLLRDSLGVYRRMVFASNGTKYVHEAAIDFALIDERGSRILVQAAGARWLAVSPEAMAYPSGRLDREDVAREVRALVRRNAAPTVGAAERVLEVGARVQLVGYKTASADATGEAAGYRLPPQRATLRSGPDLPLVITSLADLE